jgi:hyaluronate lyase
VSLAFEQGTDPTDAGYAYVVLPNQTSASTATYAANPDVTILENSTSAQAAYDASINAYGANFWTTTAHTVYDKNGSAFLTAAQQASVTTVQTGTELDVAVADPTQANTGTINLTIGRSASAVISADPNVTITQLTPTIQLSVNVSGSAGRSFQAKFTMNPRTFQLSDVVDAYVQDGASANTNYGSATNLYLKNANTGYNRISYLMFNFSSISGPITNATVYLTPTAEGESGFTNQAYLVTNSTWTESGITWNNRPPLSSTLLGNWLVPAVNTQISFDVTAQAVSAQSNGNLLSIGITSPTNVGSNGWVEYASKENGTTAYRPYLVITTQ